MRVEFYYRLGGVVVFIRFSGVFGVVAALIALGGCASTSITPISKNKVLISTSADAECGTNGAARVASQMAAVATLRNGYERYVILGGGVQDNTQTVTSGPTYSNTYGTTSIYGNTASSSSTTYYGGGYSYQSGSNNAEFAVQMFNPGEAGYKNALDAKTVLGNEWEKKVENGINTCT